MALSFASSPTSTITSIPWRVIIVISEFIKNLFIVIRNYFWNSNSITAFNVSMRIRETNGDEILRKKDECIVRVQQWCNTSTSRTVVAFTNTGPCPGEDDVSTAYGSDLSAIDSGIDSPSISRVSTNETLPEGAEESEVIHTSLRQSTRKWCDRNGEIELGGGVCNVLRDFTRARDDSSAASSLSSSMYRSTRQNLSIIRHVLRVRNAHRKRSKSVLAVVGIQ